jgi:pyruvate/2-oxoglutarate dehydrogenase complex dihydrolipoamide acyltransferase (E2) component
MTEFIWRLPDLGNRPDLPNLSATILQIQEWHVSEGVRVEMNQPLVKLKTPEEDMTLTIDSPVTGTVKSLPIAAGQVVRTGDILVIFDKEE